MFTSTVTTVVRVFYEISVYTPVAYTGQPVSIPYQYDRFPFCTVILRAYAYTYAGEPYLLVT